MIIVPRRDGHKSGFTLIELLVPVAIIGILAAIAIPQYARFRREALESVSRSAYRSVATAQEAFYISEGKYTTSYAELVEIAGLVIDSNVFYGPISVTYTSEPPIFMFSLNHKREPSTTYTYENGKQVVTGGPRVLVNDPSVPVP